MSLLRKCRSELAESPQPPFPELARRWSRGLDGRGIVMAMSDKTRELFTRAVTVPEEDIDLGTVALLIAREEYPELNPGVYLGRLDTMAQEVAGRLQGSTDPRRTVEVLNNYLFSQEGFRGNEDDYYDPRNSFLNDVLDRKLGIPITLSLVYTELGRRIGFPLAGVGMPGHFLLRPPLHREEWYIDAFNHGTVLSPEDCAERLGSVYGGRIQFQPELLATVNKRQFLARMLANLKGIYLQRRDFPRALAAIERILIVEPEAAEQVRDRGLALFQMGQYSQAVASLERYLALSPDASDGEGVRGSIRSIWELIAKLN